MEAAVVTRVPRPLPAAGRPILLAALARSGGGFASISAPSSSTSGGGGGGRFSAGGGGRGGGDDSGAGAAAASAAVAALGEAEPSDGDADAIVLHVGGMSCSGCAAKVKRILENQVRCLHLRTVRPGDSASTFETNTTAGAFERCCCSYTSRVKRKGQKERPEVAAAAVDVEKATAVVWTTPEAKATKDWQKQLGEKLANHLTTCGFQSHVQDEGEAEPSDS